MIRYLFKPLVLLVAITFCVTKSHSQSLSTSYYGIWDRGEGVIDYSDPQANFVLGIETSAVWEDIQPSGPNSWDFSAFQASLDLAVANNKLIRFSVNVGPDCPLWLFDNGVPKVDVISNAPKNDAFAVHGYPYYLNANYKTYYFQMIEKFALFLRNQPQEKFSHIAFVQVKTGATGDEEAYKGTVSNVNPQYAISSPDWETFRLECFAKFKQYFNDVSDHKIVLTFNNVDPDQQPDAYNFVMNDLDPLIGFGIKGGAYNRGHHLSDEQTFKEQWTPFLINPKVSAGNPHGVKLFSASEMDQSWTKGFFALNYEIGFYWAALGGLNTGVSCTNVSVSAMQYAFANPGIIETFKMYNKYAQQVYPETATTAFSVFHEGLNAADKVKFPVGTYGTASQSNVSRYQAICNDPKYYNRGARLEDPVSVTAGQVYQRENQNFYNDAGWEIAEGNIERFMTQINPDDTSIGLFRVRGPITATSSKYDRFARSFENSSNKNTMYFKLDSQLPTTNKALRFVITWLDKTQTTGSTWAFKYRNAAGLQSIPFMGAGTNEWKTETITISDAIINQGGTLQSDFMLVNTDTTDDIFNGIEMNILQGQTINFNALPSKKVGDADFSPAATSSSGLVITYTSSNINVATIVGDNIHIVGSGACTITASQAGNNYYNSTSVSQYLSVGVETQTTITTTGTWTCPASINKIKVEVWGGGGGGGGAYLAGFAGGGAGGSYVINDSVNVVPTTSYNVTVGAGGAQSGTGINGVNGNPGSNTTFGSTTPVIANGGVAGGATTTAGQLGSGGTNSSGGSGGTVTLGLPGASGASGSGGSGGAGAGDLGGAGGASKTSLGAGNSGTSPGGGGGGAYGAISGSRVGGAGGAGQIIITYRVGAPNAPTIGTATVSGSGQASIPFTAPVFNGNTTITSYIATSSPGGITATVSQAGSGTIIVNGLTIGTAYIFTVRAINSIGESDDSAPSNAVTPYTIPDAPTIGTAALTGIVGQATISFTAPAYNGGSPITSYIATSSPGGFTGILSQPGSGTITVNGLTNGTTYTFTVRAANVAGLGAVSGISNAVTHDYRTPQTITFGTLSAVNYGDAVLPGATASSGLPLTYTTSNSLVAITSGSTITVVGTGSATITASQGGNSTYAPATLVSQTLVVNKKALSITTPSITSKVYNALPASGVVIPGTLSGFVGAETITATATGLYADANVGTAKLATITYTLADGTNGGKAANYSLASGTADGAITRAPLTVTGVVANNKLQDDNTTATLSALGSLSGVLAADTANVTLNSSSVTANFDTATAGAAKPITISGYTISGSASANYSLSQPTGITANIAPPATITAGSATTFCSGGSVTLSANTGSGLTYLWSTGATTQSIAVTVSGSYTVTVIGTGGSATSVATTVTVNPNTTHTTTVTAFKTYTWSAGNGNTYTASGNYTNVVGCHTETLALTITNIPPNGSPDLSFCKGATIASATGSTSLKFYTASGGGASLGSTTALTTKILYITEVINGEESTPRVARGIVVNNLPATPSSIISSESALICKYIGSSTPVTFTATATGAVSYIWTVPTGAAIDSGANSSSGIGTSSSIGLIFAGVSATPGDIGAITVKSVDANGCVSLVKSLTLTTKVPTAPTALTLTSDDTTPYFNVAGVPTGLNTLAKITKVGPYMGTETVFTITAPAAVTAASYLWTLPTGVNAIASSTVAISLLGVVTSSTPVITANFADVTPGTTALPIVVQSVGGCGNSTNRTLSLARVIPTAPTALVLTNTSQPNLSSLAKITKVGPYTGTDIAFTLTATPFTTQGAEATSYAWVLPTGVVCTTCSPTTDTTVSVATTAPDPITSLPVTTTTTLDAFSSATSTITVKFSGAATKTTGELLLSVYAVNGSGNSVAKTLKLARVLPTTPTKLELKDGASVVTKVGPYTAKETPLTLTATPFTTQGAEATSFSWVLPAGVNVTAGHTNLTTPETDGNGNKTWTSTGTVLTINLAGISGSSPSMTSIPLNVYAVNGAGTSATAKTVTVTAAAPATPGSITTPTAVIPTYNPACSGTTSITVQVPSVFGVSYAWTVGAGATITSGQGTHSITIDVENVTTTTLTLGVVGSNETGSSLPRILTIKKVATCREASNTIANEFNVIAYPNPFSSEFTIEASRKGATNVRVYDMVGRLIENRQVNSNAVEVGKNYDSGVYNVIVTQDANVKTLRVIKQ